MFIAKLKTATCERILFSQSTDEPTTTTSAPPPLGGPRQTPFPCRVGLVRAVIFSSLFASMTLGSRAQQSKPDLSDISLDTLANTEITSVSRKAEKLSSAAAAVFVITHEDIRRSGLASIPELLRMVPGLTVAQIDASKWAITARGFNERLADKQ